MQVERSIVYNADLESVLGVLISKKLANARAESAGIALPQHTVSGESSAPKAVTVVTVPADKLPDKVRRLINRDIVLTITQTWDGTGPERAAADFTVDAGSLPVKVNLTQTLVANGETTTSTFSGDVTVSIPIVGKRIEQAAAGRIDQILTGDQKLVNDLLANR